MQKYVNVAASFALFAGLCTATADFAEAAPKKQKSTKPVKEDSQCLQSSEIKNYMAKGNYVPLSILETEDQEDPQEEIQYATSTKTYLFANKDKKWNLMGENAGKICTIVKGTDLEYVSEYNDTFTKIAAPHKLLPEEKEGKISCDNFIQKTLTRYRTEHEENAVFKGKTDAQTDFYFLRTYGSESWTTMVFEPNDLRTGCRYRQGVGQSSVLSAKALAIVFDFESSILSEEKETPMVENGAPLKGKTSYPKRNINP